MRKNIQHMIFLFAIATGICQQINAQTKAPAYKLPKYEKFTLPNGLTIYLMEKHTVPVISISAIIPAGAVFDGDKAGLASLTGQCLTIGTKNYSKTDIENAFDFAGASIYTSGNKETASIIAKLAIKDEDKLLPIIKEIMVDPSFNEEEFAKEKNLTIAGLKQAKESPSRVIMDYWDKFYYGNNVLGNVVDGTVSSVTNLTRNDLNNFYKKYYNPKGSVIAVAGDFNTKEMKARLTKLFGDWKKLPVANNPYSQPIVVPSSSRVLLVNKDDARETTMMIGTKGVARNNPDYIAIQVVNTVFGGRFTSWLNEELRVKSGLTYGAGSYFLTNKNNGLFILSTHTANATTQPTIDKALEQLKRLHDQPIDEETLTSAKNYMIGLFPPRFQTTSELAGLMASMFWFGFDESYINNFQANVNAVTIDKAKEIVAKYFPDNALQFVFIGKGDEIKKLAQKYAPVTEVQLKDEIGKGF